MRKKLLAIFSALLIACTLGAVGLSVSALDSSIPELKITQVNTANPADTGISICVDTNAPELGFSKVEGANQYVLVNGSQAADVEQCGTNIRINKGTEPAVGTTLTLKAGLQYGGLELKSDVTYTYQTALQPWVRSDGATYTPTVGTYIHRSGLNDSKTALTSLKVDDGSPLSTDWYNLVIVDMGAGVKISEVEAMTPAAPELFFVDGNIDEMFVLTDANMVNKLHHVLYKQDTAQNKSYAFIYGDTATSVGDMLTIKAGTLWGNYQVKEDCSFIYQTKGQTWVRGSIPTGYTLRGETNMYVNTTQKLEWTLVPADAIGVPSFTSSDETIATVSADGTVTANNKTGSVTITANLNGIVKELTIQVGEVTEREFRVKKDYTTYYVPQTTTVNGKTFEYKLLQRYTLQYYYINNGVPDATLHNVTESMLSTIDYTTTGSKTVTITDPNDATLSDSINVNIHELKLVNKVDDFGVGDYDMNDTRYKEETWNGHLLLGMSGASTNNKYIRHSEAVTPEEEAQYPGKNKTDNRAVYAITETSSYIYYKVAATGKTYNNILENTNKRISIWQLESTFLVMIRPDDASGNMVSSPVGYGSEATWGRLQPGDAEYHPYTPIYKNGDEVTLKAGMPIYKWVENNGNDDYIIEAVVSEDTMYRCTENGTDNTWKLIRGYTDFTVTDTYSIGVEKGATLDTKRVPATATSGTFTYESSDTSVVEVDASGTMYGKKIGTATITITLSGVDEEGNPLPTITKQVTVNVIKALTNITGTFKLGLNTVIDDSILAQMKVTVTYSDGSKEQIALNDSRMTVQTINTSKTGTKKVRVKFAYTDADKDRTFQIQVEIVDNGGNGGVVDGGGTGDGGAGGSGVSCSGSLSVAGLLPLALLGAGAILIKRRKDKK